MRLSDTPLDALTSTLYTIALVVALPLVVLLISSVAVDVRRRWGRRAAARKPPAQQLIWRGEFMRELINQVGHDTVRPRKLSKISRRLGWSMGQALLVVDYLSAKGLVEQKRLWAKQHEPFKSLGDRFGERRVRVTNSGLDEAQQAESGPTKHLAQTHIFATNSIVTYDSPGAAIQSPGHNFASAIQSPGSAIASPRSTQTLVQEGLDPAKLADWIRMYREALDQPTSLSEPSVRHARSLLDELEDALDQGDPTTVDRLGRTLRVIAEGVVGNAIFALILDTAQAFPFGS